MVLRKNCWIEKDGGYGGRISYYIKGNLVKRTYANGRVEHYKNGSFHNDNGPAVIESTGTKYWFRNNEIHREDGPAVEYPFPQYGLGLFYLNGRRYATNQSFQEALAKLKGR